MRFRIVIQPDLEEGGFIVSCPALPGCHSQGDTVESALVNIDDAIKGYIESLRKHGRSVPQEIEIEVAI